MKNTFGVIAVTYGQCFKNSFFHSINEQTYKNFDMHIYHDGPDVDGWEQRLIMPKNFTWHNSATRENCYGHNCRNHGIAEQADNYHWLMITNCDNYYVPIAFESLMETVLKNQRIGVCYFDMVHSHHRGDSSSGGTYGFFRTEFRSCQCDIGSFIVRGNIAKAIGFPWRDAIGDGHFIEQIKILQNSLGFLICKLNKVLLVHN